MNKSKTIFKQIKFNRLKKKFKTMNKFNYKLNNPILSQNNIKRISFKNWIIN